MEKVEEKTDRIFVPIKKPVLMGQTGDFSGNQPIWLPTSADNSISIFDKTLLTQVKNQLELVEGIETNSYKAPDYNKEVVEYGSKRTIQA